MTCPRCQATFETRRSWQRYCSERCRRQGAGRERRARLARVAPSVHTCAYCGTSFVPDRGTRLYCSMRCKIRAANDKRRDTPLGRRLHCHWCKGKHISTSCPNRDGKSVKQFGTVVNGEYVPPPGVRVRIVSIPTTIHSEALTRMLKEMEA